jgi:hypothetical protein
MRNNQPHTAVKLFNRVIRWRCLQIVEDKKKNERFFRDDLEKQNLEEADFFVDLKLGSFNQIKNMFKSLSKQRIITKEGQHSLSNTSRDQVSKYDIFKTGAKEEERLTRQGGIVDQDGHF